MRSVIEWVEYCRSGKKPIDIPTAPRGVYADWSSWGDWLGTGTVATPLREFLSFKKARAFARSLGLKKKDDWVNYCALRKKPKDVPSNPNHQYAQEWSSWADWLGAGGHRGNGWRSFTKARSFVRRLHLRSTDEWREYLSSKKKPHDIPANPHDVYADKGWTGYGDFLGTGRVPPGSWRSFKEARAFARGLGLRSVVKWTEYVKSGKKPHDIPADPYDVYADKGWSGWGDFLGTGRVPIETWRSFKEARAFVHKRHLRSNAEWREYYRSGKKPKDIPANPDREYRGAGWVSWGNWLGTGRAYRHNWRRFNNARAFVRRLGLKSWDQWSKYCKSGKKPNDIPAHPDRIFADAGWAGMGDWLGYARNAQARERSQTVPRIQGTRRVSPASNHVVRI